MDKGSQRDLQPMAKKFEDFIAIEGKAKLEWVTNAKVSWYMYNNLFHYYVDPRNSSFLRSDRELMETCLRFPLVRRLVTLAASTVLSQPYEFTVSPASDTREDYIIAQAKSLVLRDFDARNPSAIDDLAIMMDTINLGVSFRRVYIDREWVPSLVSAEQVTGYQQSGGLVRSVSQMGEDQFRVVTPRNVIKQTYVSGFDMIVPTGAKSLLEVRKFVRREIRPIEWILEKYGVDIAPETILDRHVSNKGDDVGASINNTSRTMSNQTGVSIGSDSNMVRVYHCWEKIGDYWHNLVLVGNDKMKPVDYHVTYEHDMVEITCPRTDTFWPYGLTSQVHDEQRALTLQYRNLHKSFDENLKTIVVMENTVKDNISNQFSQVIRINRQTTNPPQIIQMPSGVHQQCLSMMQVSEEAIYKSYGLSEASRGVTKSHVPEAALQSARETDTGPLSFMRKSLEFSCVELRKKVLSFAEQNGIYDQPTLLTMTTPDQAGTFSRVIQTGDLAGNSDIQIHNISQWPKSISQRLDIASKMASIGLFTPGNEAVARNFKEFIGVQRGMIPQPMIALRQEQRALEEGQLAKHGMLSSLPVFDQEAGGGITMGPIVNKQTMLPLLDPMDIDEIHLEQHRIDYMELPIGSRAAQFLGQHISEHEDRIQQAQMAAEERRIEMVARESAASQAPQVEMAKMAADQRMSQGQMVAETNAKVKTFEVSTKAALESRNLAIKELEALNQSVIT